MTSFQPLTEQIQVRISKQRIVVVPSPLSGLHVNGATQTHDKEQADNPIDERSFEVEVINQSDRFASFGIELSTPGQPTQAANHWYDIEPKVCAKKPPGDRTTFRVIINRPPIPAIDTTVDLMVHVFSVEYDDLETVHHLDLEIKERSHPLQVHLVSPHLKAHPGDRMEIEVLALNLQSEPTDITVKILGINKDWLIPLDADKDVNEVEVMNPHILRHTLRGGDTRRIAFYCIPPTQPITASRVYDFDVEISDRRGNFSTTAGHIEVLPAGMVTFECATRRQFIPDANDRWNLHRWDKALFPLIFENCSNLTQQVHIQASEVHRHKCSIPPIPPIELSPGDSQPLNLGIRRKQPWLGWERRLLVDVTPTLTYPNDGNEIDPIVLKPSSRSLDVRVRPVIPLWLQVGGGLLALLLLAWWLWLRPIVRHTAPITTLQIMGKESTVLTGSRDQTVYRWDVRSSLGWVPHVPMLRDRTQLASADELTRAVRVIRQSPRDETQVAIGLENGVIALWDIAREEPVKRIADRTDRVFALAFTPDAQSLFSGHGSGIVRRWAVQGESQATPRQTLPLPNTAIADLEVLNDQGRSLVAIGGQFNRLILWDWVRDKAYPVDYQWNRDFQVSPTIGSYHSLTELEVSRDGRLLMTSDNRGFVTAWDGQQLVECTQRSDLPQFRQLSGTALVPLDCDVSELQQDQWQITEDGMAVRTMALSEDGCYLTTATDDGAIALWTMNPETGARVSEEPVPLHSFSNYSPYEIDIKQYDADHLLIAVDGPDYRAHLLHHTLDEQSRCPISFDSDEN